MQSLQGIWLGVYKAPVPLESPPWVPYSVTCWTAIHYAMQGPPPLKGQKDLHCLTGRDLCLKPQDPKLVTKVNAPWGKQKADDFITAISRHHHDYATPPSPTVALTCWSYLVSHIWLKGVHWWPGIFSVHPAFRLLHPTRGGSHWRNLPSLHF